MGNKERFSEVSGFLDADKGTRIVNMLIWKDQIIVAREYGVYRIVDGAAELIMGPEDFRRCDIEFEQKRVHLSQNRIMEE